MACPNILSFTGAVETGLLATRRLNAASSEARLLLSLLRSEIGKEPWQIPSCLPSGRLSVNFAGALLQVDIRTYRRNRVAANQSCKVARDVHHFFALEQSSASKSLARGRLNGFRKRPLG